MEIDYSNTWDKKCPQIKCRKDQCTGLTYVFIPAALGDDRKGSKVAPKNGAYCNAIVLYEADHAVYIYSKEGVPTKVASGYTFYNDILDRPFYNGEMMTSSTSIPKVPDAVSELTNDLNYQTKNDVDAAILVETTARELADQTLQGEIDTIVASSDVKDIVGTYAELQAYDTSTLGNNDIIKVLQDETHNDAETYYRWSTSTETFTYIGELGPFYTKSETDTLLGGKQDTLTAGSGIAITNNVVSQKGYDIGNRTVFYVDWTNGNDNNDGTTDHPFKTMTKALSKLNEGYDNIRITFKSGGTYNIGSSSTYISGKYIEIKTESGVSGVNLQLTTDWILNNTYLNINGESANHITISQNSTYRSIQFYGGYFASYYTDYDSVRIAAQGSTVHIEQASSFCAIYGRGSNARLISITVTESGYTANAPIYFVEGGDVELGTITAAARTAALASPFVKLESGSHLSINGTFTNNTTAGLSYTYGIHANASILQEQGAYLNQYNTIGSGISTSAATLNVKDSTTLPYVAGSNISISGSTISGNYQPFTGTDGNTAGTAGLVPAPATTDAGKILGADGTWKAIDHTFETFTFTLVDNTVVAKNIAVEA